MGSLLHSGIIFILARGLLTILVKSFGQDRVVVISLVHLNYGLGYIRSWR